MITTTLRDISKYTSTLKKQLVFSSNYKDGDLNSFDKSYKLYTTGSSKDELLKSFDNDITNTVNELDKVQELLKHTKDGKFLEIDGETNDIREIFGEKFNKETNSVTLNGIDFNLQFLQQNMKFEKGELKEKMIKNLFDIEISQWNELVKHSTRIYLSRSKKNKIEYLSYIDKREELENLIAVIENKLEGESNFYDTLSREDKDIVNNRLGQTRTMIDGVIQSSTFISQDGEEQVSTSHKKNMERVDRLRQEVKNSKYFNGVEVDQDVHIDKFINRMKQIENFNLNVSSKRVFKRRKIKNYHRNGLYVPHKKIVSVDVDKPSRLIHEVRHHIDFNTNNSNRYEREKLVNKLRDKIDIDKLSKEVSNTNYYLNDREIIRRRREVRYMLQVEDSDKEELKRDLVSEDNDDEMKLIKSKSYYQNQKNIYFNFDEWSMEEREELKTFFNSFFRIDKDLPLVPVKEGNVNYELRNENKNKNFRIQRKIRRESFYSNINGDNIDRIIQLNKEKKLVDEMELYENIMGNIEDTGGIHKVDKEGKKKNGYTTSEYVELMEDTSIIIDRCLSNSKELLSDRDYNVFLTKYINTHHIKNNVILVDRDRKTRRRIEEVVGENSYVNKIKDIYDNNFTSHTPNFLKLYNDNLSFAAETGEFQYLMDINLFEVINTTKTLVNNYSSKKYFNEPTINDIDIKSLEKSKKYYDEYVSYLSPIEKERRFSNNVYEEYEEQKRDYDFYIKDTKQLVRGYRNKYILKEDGKFFYETYEGYSHSSEIKKEEVTSIERQKSLINGIDGGWRDREKFIIRYEDFENISEEEIKDKIKTMLEVTIFQEELDTEKEYQSHVKNRLETYLDNNRLWDLKTYSGDIQTELEKLQEEKLEIEKNKKLETYKEEINKYTQSNYGEDYCSDIKELKDREDYMLHTYPRDRGVMGVVKYSMGDNGVNEEESKEFSTVNRDFYKYERREEVVNGKNENTIINIKKDLLDSKFVEYVTQENEGTRDWNVYQRLFKEVKVENQSKDFVSRLIKQDIGVYKLMANNIDNPMNFDKEILLQVLSSEDKEDNKYLFKRYIPDEVKEKYSKTNRVDLFVKKLETLLEEEKQKVQKELDKQKKTSKPKTSTKVESNSSKSVKTEEPKEIISPKGKVVEETYFKSISHILKYINKLSNDNKRATYQKGDNEILSVVFDGVVVRKVDKNKESSNFNNLDIYIKKEELNSMIDNRGNKTIKSPSTKTQREIVQEKVKRSMGEIEQGTEHHTSYHQPSLF